MKPILLGILKIIILTIILLMMILTKMMLISHEAEIITHVDLDKREYNRDKARTMLSMMSMIKVILRMMMTRTLRQ